MALAAGSSSSMIKSRAYIRRLNWEVLLVTISVLGLLSTQATAASFDCKKATTKFEKTVCANPELSQLDEEMAKAYHEALTSLSSEGQKETKDYQKQWLKKVSSFSKKGIKNGYEERIKQLQQCLIKFPDRTFRNVYVTYFFKTDEKCSLDYARYLTYPQIENPRDENEKAWNNFLFKEATNFTPDEDCQQIHDSYTVSFSNKHLISVKYSNFTYTEGAPMPAQAGAEGLSWLLKSRRELKVEDLFNEKVDWRNKIRELAIQQMENHEDSEELKQIIESPSDWEISKDGLGFLSFFNAAGYGTDPFVVIKWKTLEPYLSKDGRSLISD
ncbi:MAG: lysozyme inhibitor LprI family protein [Smithella sp.]|jgi:uncharacterized protein